MSPHLAAIPSLQGVGASHLLGSFLLPGICLSHVCGLAAILRNIPEDDPSLTGQMATELSGLGADTLMLVKGLRYPSVDPGGDLTCHFVFWRCKCE